MGDFPYMEWLTRLYKERGEKSGKWTDYLKAHGLANYCVVKESTEDKRRLVYDIENSWYKGKHPLSFDEHQEMIDEHKELLKNYRAEITADFNDLEAEGKTLDCDDMFSDENIGHALNYSHGVFKAITKSTNDFINVSKDIIQSSVNVLAKGQLSAPCEFVVIGLGSIAKSEATPYSDLEYAFIVQRNAGDRYFDALAMDSYFRIGNIGESPLKGFDIDEVKTQSQIFIDTIPAGYRIDGITKNSGNIPTGNGKDGNNRLIFTVSSFVEFYQASAEKPFDGFAGDKSDMLSSTVVIYTNEGEMSLLYIDAVKARKIYENTEAKHHSEVKQKRLQSFAKDIETYSFLPKFVSFQPPKNLDIKVKVDIFRFPTLLANNFKMCLGYVLPDYTSQQNLCAMPSWEIFNILHSQGVLSQANLEYLNIVMALSVYLRANAYLKQGAQIELVSLRADIAGKAQSRYRVPSNLFILLGCLLVPIKQAMAQNLPDVDGGSKDSWTSCNGNPLVAMMKHIDIDQTNLLIKGEVCYFTGEYERSLQIFDSTINEMMKMREISSVTKYVEMASYLLYHTGRFSVAADYFEFLSRNTTSNKGIWKLLTAHCKKEIGDYITSRKLINEVNALQKGVKQSSELYVKFYGADTYHTDIANSLNAIGAVYGRLGDASTALTYYVKSLEMNKALYDTNAGHHEIANSYNNIGNAYCGLGEHNLAIAIYTKSLEMMEAVYGADHADPLIAHSYNNIGNANQNLGKYKVAMEYHTKSLEMRKAIYGIDKDNPNIASSYSNIGNTYDKLGEYKVAIDYYTKSLNMRKAIYGTENEHPDIASSYSNIGNAYRNLGEFKVAIGYYTKSLTMMEAVYGTGNRHPEIAGGYSNIGNAYRISGEYKLAVECYTKSLKMMEAIYGTDNKHPVIASTYNNMGNAYKDLGEYKVAIECYTKSLTMRKAIYGIEKDHPEIASGYSNIGSVYSAIGENHIAIKYYTKALKMMKAIYGTGNEHSDVGSSYNNIGNAYKNLGEYNVAMEYYTKAFKTMKAIYGTYHEHPHFAVIYSNIGRACYALGNYEVALQYYTKSLETLKASSRPD